MNDTSFLRAKLLSVFLLIGVTFGSFTAAAAERSALDNDVHAAMALLLETSPVAKILAPSAKGALVFPTIVKAGFIVGVQYGNGAPLEPGGAGAITSPSITTSPRLPSVCRRVCRHSDTRCF